VISPDPPPGAIQASLFVTAQLSSACGSFVLGVTKEAVGSFQPVLLALVVLNGLLCLALCAYVLSRGPPRGEGASGHQACEIPTPAVIRACSSSSAMHGEAV
jgi:hypothetical protein